MDEPAVRAMKRLTIAVWALTAVVGISVALVVTAYVLLFRPQVTYYPEVPVDPPLPADEMEGFSDFPLERQLEAATVVAILRYVPEGEKQKCVFAEFLKRQPDVIFPYNIGDEFRMCSFMQKANESRGEGQLAFFVGNPASFRFSTSFYGSTLSSYGDLSIDALREMAKTHAQ